MNGSLPLLTFRTSKKFNLRPSKAGTNFLQDNAALQKIVSAAELGPSEAVLEIGPVGNLTVTWRSGAVRSPPSNWTVSISRAGSVLVL